MADSDAEELSVGVPSPVSEYRPYTRAIDGDEDGSSGFSTPSRSRNDGNDMLDAASGNSNSISQRHPTCALCKNHQTISTLKGHKRYCPWRSCLCELCYGTNKKRKINAEQVASRRAQAQDEELRKKGILYHSPASPSLSTSSATGRQPNQSFPKNRSRGKEDSSSKKETDSSSQIYSPGSNCQSGPAVFGQRLSFQSILMSQNVSMLRESVCDSAIGLDVLTFLFRVVQEVKDEIEKVINVQLNEIQQKIQMRIHSGDLNLVSCPNLVYPQEQVQRVWPMVPVSVQHFSMPSDFHSQFRPSVITGPYPSIPHSMYNS